MFYIIEINTEITIAITKDREVAGWIAANIGKKCEIRWSWR